MRRLNFLLVLSALTAVILFTACPKPPPPAPPPPPPVDTTPVQVDTPKPPVEEPKEPPKKILQESRLKTIYFDTDKSTLRADAKMDLDQNYQLLMEHPDVIILVEGHCDERNTIEYNLALGDRRANAAKDYLIGLGVAPARVQTITYGEERPVDPRSNEEAWQKNRRCEFRIVSQ